MKNNSTFSDEPLSQIEAPLESGEMLALVLIWSRDEPARVGEVWLIPPTPTGQEWTLGRGMPVEMGGGRLKPVRQRPGSLLPTGPLISPRISRDQLLIRVEQNGTLEVENVGRAHLYVRDQETKHTVIAPGDLLELHNELTFLCVRRPGLIPLHPDAKSGSIHVFGAPDVFGMVGESTQMWELRRQIAMLAAQSNHVLILGASGTGKELVARALHISSARRNRPLISRNAATIPEGLIDAELFGNMKNYPNPGMPERSGLVGEADGSSLFLDEFAELPAALQAHLLRVMDDGEYQRLGESGPRRSSFRLIAATNRSQRHLKHDILARLKSRLRLPDLNARREDIPLLTRHLLRRLAVQDPGLALRYFRDGDAAGDPRITPAFMSALVRHRFTTHVRELERILLDAVSESRGRYLDLTAELRRELDSSRSPSSTGGPTQVREKAIDEAIERTVNGRATAFRSSHLPPELPEIEAVGPVPDQLEARPKRAQVNPDLQLPTAHPNGHGSESSPHQRPGGAALSLTIEQLGATVRASLPKGMTYEALNELCEELKAAYVARVLEASDGRLFRAARLLECNRDVIRRCLERHRRSGG